ncbi:flagellar assembly protein FliW [Cellulomonas cellasea]|uniref:flagellar assembly protein FliW n=1 Tax=Cellulomonas cellasea TaxID=43670 RepID=UPI0025A4C508|nr:flagellar assembly protein FliW [Cellulomonas cellasea]MDM8083404.1 flagellar assembly protein FliW [Cellulomonas cellasea]
MSALPVDGLPVDALPPSGRRMPPALRLCSPLPGLPGHDTFTMDPLDDDGTLYAMRSTPADRPPVRLFVVPPRVFFPDYAPSVDAEAHTLVGGRAEDHLLLVVVHPAERDTPPTANLLAPLVIDPATGSAMQTVLGDGDWPLHAPLG